MKACKLSEHWEAGNVVFGAEYARMKKNLDAEWKAAVRKADNQ